MITPSGFHGGHIDSKPDSRDCKIGDFIPKLKAEGLLPPLPAVFGHGNDFLGEAWGMFGNGPAPANTTIPASWTAARKGAGLCEVAGKFHEFMADAANAGRPIPTFTDRIAIETYMILTKLANGTAYDPVSGSGDTGLETRAVLNYCQKTGFTDADNVTYKIADYLFGEAKNVEELFYFIWLTERACIAIEFPESADGDFAQNVPWEVTPGSPIVGGHYVFGCGKPAAAGLVAFITWARRTLMTILFFQQFNSELASYIDLEQFRTTTNKDWEGHSPEEVERFLTLAARQKAVLL